MNCAPGEKQCILIVDDTPHNIQLVANILKSDEYRIMIAQSGAKALASAERVIPDLILLDIMMPEMDGMETCRRLKSKPETRDIPVIFLTARTSPEDIKDAFAAGGVDYITKPFNSSELAVRVRTHLELKASRDVIQQISEERKELLHVLCHDLTTPFHAILSLLGGDDDNMGLEKYRRRKGILMQAAKNGLDLIELIRRMRAIEEYEVQLESINLHQAVQASILLVAEKFQQKNIHFEVDMDDDLFVMVEIASFINSVLNNLLTNAAKFSFKNSRVSIRAASAGDMVEMAVVDTGIGMPEKLVADLFQISRATSRPGTEGESGTGFGMPLVKKFILTYGGRIEVFSREMALFPQDHGTEIRLTLKKDKAC